MRTLLLSAVLLLTVTGLGGAFWFYRTPGGATSSFRSEVVKQGDLLITVDATGTLEPEDVIDVGAQVAGLIKEFGTGADGKPIEYGSPVSPGTVLARIDDSLYSAKVEQSRALLGSAQQRLIQAKTKVDQAVANTNKARADLKVAQAKDKQSTRDWERAKTLKPGGSISPQDYDAALGAYEINSAGLGVAEAVIVQSVASESDARAAVGDAEAAVNTAKAVLRQDELNLGYCTIKSDVAGTIIDRRVTIGQTVQSSFNTPSLFLIAKDMKRMKVWASVNESDIGKVRVGQPVRFGVDAYPRQTFKGTVARIRLNATNTQNVVIYTVEILTENPKGILLPYMTANLKFEVDSRKDVLLVANAALRYRPAANLIVADATPAKETPDKAVEKEKSAERERSERSNRGVVYVEVNGKLKPINVELGLTDGNVSEVISGDLKDGDKLVVGEIRTGAPSTAENPFAPKMFGGNKK